MRRADHRPPSIRLEARRKLIIGPNNPIYRAAESLSISLALGIYFILSLTMYLLNKTLAPLNWVYDHSFLAQVGPTAFRTGTIYFTINGCFDIKECCAETIAHYRSNLKPVLLLTSIRNSLNTTVRMVLR